MKKYLNVTSFLSSLDDRVGALLPGQADVGAEAVLRPGALVPGLHDARAGAGDDHEARRGHLAAELDAPAGTPCRVGCVRAEPNMVTLRTLRVGREELEGVAQLPQRRLDHAHIAAVLHVLQQLQRVLDDVGHDLLVVAAALVGDELLNPPFQFGVHRRLFCFFHGGEDSRGIGHESNARLAPSRRQAGTRRRGRVRNAA